MSRKLYILRMTKIIVMKDKEAEICAKLLKSLEDAKLTFDELAKALRSCTVWARKLKGGNL